MIFRPEDSLSRLLFLILDHMPKSKSLAVRIAAGFLLLAALFWTVSFCAAQVEEAELGGSAPIYGYRIINTYPHDETAFTQGLVYDRGELYEGTGLYGCSTLRQVDLETGRVLKLIHLPDTLFGEGVTVWQDQLIQLTWQSGIGLIYDRENLTEIGRFGYPTEGWGITTDGRRLIMSDGTETLHILDPETFAEQGRIEVREDGVPVIGLNELEYVDGEIFANVWPNAWIAIISLETGEVLGRIDLQDILPEEGDQRRNVLNGVAYDAEKGRLFLTGKLWSKLIEIELYQEIGKNKSGKGRNV